MIFQNKISAESNSQRFFKLKDIEIRNLELETTNQFLSIDMQLKAERFQRSQKKFFLRISKRIETYQKKSPETVRTEPDLMNNEKLLNHASLWCLIKVQDQGFNFLYIVQLLLAIQ